MPKPNAEVEITEKIVRRLIEAQIPEYAADRIELIDEGWDNAMYRCGSDRVVRLPRRKVGADLMVKELEWLPQIGPDLPIPVPVPVFEGSPTDFFPWPWSIVPWVDGYTANVRPVHTGEAERFALFLRRLHQPAGHEVPINQFRGIPLQQAKEKVEKTLQRLSGKTGLVSPTVWEIWNAALKADASIHSCLLHGDLHARNVIVGEDGKIVSIIDWGDLCRGDRATDLMSIWSLFDCAAARKEVIASYQMGDSLLFRSQGWAVSMAAMLLDSDHPEHAEMGRDILARLIEDY